MSLPCIEVASAPGTEAFLATPKDRSHVEPALTLLKGTKGLIKYVHQDRVSHVHAIDVAASIYYGQQAEDPKQIYVYNGE